MEKLLKKLVETPGVSGNEGEIRETIRSEIEKHVDDISEDSLGNLICRKSGSGPRLMIAAHMDQIGLSVKRIDEDGFIHFSKVGGITLQSLLNQRVIIHSKNKITGVIGMKPPHLMDEEERSELPDIDDLFIDIGANDKEDAKETGIQVGDFITFDRTFTSIENGYKTGMALDNRVGCAATIEATKKFSGNYELVSVFTTQEEVGLKGAKTSAYAVDPDVALAVDTSIAGDVPYIKDKESDLETGKGVEITLIQSSGRGLITSEPVKNWLIETAEQYNHPYQRGVWEGGATDAANLYLVKEGIPTGSLGIPTRHIHSSTEVVDIEDIKSTVRYLEDVFSTLPKYF